MLANIPAPSFSDAEAIQPSLYLLGSTSSLARLLGVDGRGRTRRDRLDFETTLRHQRASVAAAITRAGAWGVVPARRHKHRRPPVLSGSAASGRSLLELGAAHGLWS